MAGEKLQKLISLTFDENPQVRKEAAKKLAALEDPGALFALLELSYDKDQDVKQTAQKLLNKAKAQDKSDIISFSEIFSNPKEEQEQQKEKISKTRKLFQPIELLFERKLGKEKANIVKQKMMPSLEKVYLKATSPQSQGGSKVTDQERKAAVQEFLTTYLDAISDFPGEPIEVSDDAIETLNELESISSHDTLDDLQADRIMSEVEQSSGVDHLSPEQQHQKFLSEVPDSLFKKAYEIMMYSGGDSKLMKTEMKRMIKSTEKDIKLAFKLAKEKFKENKVTKITEIKDKMRNILTDVLVIVAKEKIEFKKKRSSSFALRFLVQDPQGNEGVLYLFKGRGDQLVPGLKIKIVKGYAKVINDETAITIGSSGNVYVVV